MFGGGSIQLGRIFGIRIGVDVSWFLFLFLIIWSLSELLRGRLAGVERLRAGTLSALLFFLSILLHELGHAVVAIRNGISIEGIDLWMFGGVAKLGRDSRSPGEEFRVAVGGPARDARDRRRLPGPGHGDLEPGGGHRELELREHARSAPRSLCSATWPSINLIVLVFNLIPGFPLDGGRIARAIAWKITGDRNRATRFAGTLGRFVGWAMIGFGIFMFIAWDSLSRGSGWHSSASLSPRRRARRSPRRTSPTASATFAYPT